MKVTYHSNNTIAAVAPDGRIDSDTSPELEKRMLALLQRGDRFLILDLSAVDYMASNGMRVLLLIAKKSREAEGKCVLVGLTPFIRDILKMTGFLQYFEEYGSVDLAVSALVQG